MLVIDGAQSAISALAFLPQGNGIIIGCRNGSLYRANLGFEKFGAMADVAINCITIDPAGSTLYCADANGWYGIQLDGGPEQGVSIPLESSPTTALAFLNESTLVVGTGDRLKALPGELHLRNLQTGQRREPRFREPTGVRAVAIHAPTHTVAWSNANHQLSVWNTLKLEPRTVALHQTAPSLAFHPDGEQLAIAQDWTIVITEVATGMERLTLKGHTGRVTAVAYRPDGKSLATASWDQTVRFWNPMTGELQAVYDWGIGRVLCLGFSPDGTQLAFGGETGKLAICDLD